MVAFLAPIAAAVVGGMFQKSASDKATKAQSASDAARLEEDRRVREQLRIDTEAQRKIADDAFAQYQSGLISYAEAQRIAGEAMERVQQGIAQSQLSDASKTTAMAEFKPYSVTTGAGKSFYDTASGQAGFQMSPEQRQYQQSLFGMTGGQLGQISPQMTPEQQALQRQMFGTAGGLAGELSRGLTPEEQAYRQQMYSGSSRLMGQLPYDLTPEQQAYQQSMGSAAQRLAADLPFEGTPEQQAYQREMYAGSSRLMGQMPYELTPEQKAYQQAMGAGAQRLAGSLAFEGTPEQRAYQQAMYGKAAEQAAGLNLDPTAQAQKYYQQQQDILKGSREAEDIAARGSLLSRGRLGLGVSQQAAGLGEGDAYVNPDEASRMLAREQINKQIAADASQRAQGDIAEQIRNTGNLFGFGAGAQDQIQRVLEGQSRMAQGLYGASAEAPAEQQRLLNQQLQNVKGMFGEGTETQNQIRKTLTEQAQTARNLYGASAEVPSDLQQLFGQQLKNAQGMFTSGQGLAAEQQQLLAKQLQNVQGAYDIGAGTQLTAEQLKQRQLQNLAGMYDASMAPETFGLDVMKMGANLGQMYQQAGQGQANLYNDAMSNYYKNLYGAAQTGQQAGLFMPQAQQVGAQEAYQRQQTYLQNLQGSNLPYQAMTMPQPLIPGSAYAAANIGNRFMDIGMKGIENYMKQPTSTYEDPYNFVTRG